MANKTFGDLTAATTVAKGSYIAIQNESGNSRKVLAEKAGVAFGSAFPGSPATDDRFYRTDRRIEYFYDGTRWLSVDLFTFQMDVTASVTTTGTGNSFASPWYNTWDIYIELFQCVTVLSGVGNWTVQLRKETAGVLADVTGAVVSGFTNTSKTPNKVTVNQVVASTVDGFAVTHTENSGTATANYWPAFTFRLVG